MDQIIRVGMAVQYTNGSQDFAATITKVNDTTVNLIYFLPEGVNVFFKENVPYDIYAKEGTFHFIGE